MHDKISPTQLYDDDDDVDDEIEAINVLRIS